MRALLIYVSAALGGLGMWALWGFDPRSKPMVDEAGNILAMLAIFAAGAGCFVGGTHGMLPPLFRTRTTLDEAFDDLNARL